MTGTLKTRRAPAFVRCKSTDSRASQISSSVLAQKPRGRSRNRSLPCSLRDHERVSVPPQVRAFIGSEIERAFEALTVCEDAEKSGFMRRHARQLQPLDSFRRHAAGASIVARGAAHAGDV